MKQTSTKTSPTQTTNPNQTTKLQPSQQGLSLMPPTYGINLADNPRPLQGKFTSPKISQLPPKVLQRKEGSGFGLPASLKTSLEQMGGVDLSDVRVNYNSSKPSRIGALAYTQGNQIEVEPGQEKHLAHEGWHAVQQKQGRVKPNATLAKGIAINNDLKLEREADVMGAKAVQMKCTSCGKEEQASSKVRFPENNKTLQFKCKECEKKEKSGVLQKKDSSTTWQSEQDNAIVNGKDDCLVTFPDVKLSNNHTIPLYEGDFYKEIPILNGKNSFKEINFEGDLRLILEAKPELFLEIKPVLLKNICLFLADDKLKFGGRAEVVLSSFLMSNVPAYGGLHSHLEAIFPTKPPFTLPVDVEGGFKSSNDIKTGPILTIPVEISYDYTDSILEMLTTPNIELLFELNSNVDFQFILSAMETELCRYDTPVADWYYKSALNLGLIYKLGIDTKTWEILYEEFEPTGDDIDDFLDRVFSVPMLSEGWSCRSLDDILDDLLEQGWINERQRSSVEIAEKDCEKEDKEYTWYKVNKALWYCEENRNGTSHRSVEHHSWPKYIGGYASQTTLRVGEKVHQQQIHGNSNYPIHKHLTDKFSASDLNGEKIKHGSPNLTGNRMFTDLCESDEDFRKRALDSIEKYYKDNYQDESTPEMPRNAYYKGLKESYDKF